MQDELSIEKARVAILVEERNDLLRKVFELEEQVRRLTPRALDGGDSAAQSAFSTPEVLSPSLSDSASRPAACNANRWADTEGDSMFVRILEWATCNVCMEIHEQIVFYQSPDGLEFSICLPCLQSAQQMLAPDKGQAAVVKDESGSAPCG